MPVKKRGFTISKSSDCNIQLHNYIIMNKIIKFTPMVLALLLFSACNNYADVKQFMAELSAAIEKNDTAAIKKMYPDAAKADSLALAFDAEKAQMETNDDGSIKIDLGEGKDITVIKNEGDDGMKVKSSHGVFAYPAYRLDLAKKTGQWKDGLNDMEQAERMNDTLFVKYLNDKIAGAIIEDLKSKVKVTKSIANYNIDNLQATGVVVVSNQSDRQLEGNEYTVTAKLYEYTGFYHTESYIGSRTLTGKVIPANGQVTYSFSYSLGAWPENPVCTISIKPRIENVMEDYQPTGKEYEEYLSQKAN